MPKLYSSKHIIKILASRGFVFISQRGSHAKFKKSLFEKDASRKVVVIVPNNKKEIPYGTFRSILRQSGLREEEFDDQK